LPRAHAADIFVPYDSARVEQAATLRHRARPLHLM